MSQGSIPACQPLPLDKGSTEHLSLLPLYGRQLLWRERALCNLSGESQSLGQECPGGPKLMSRCKQRVPCSLKAGRSSRAVCCVTVGGGKRAALQRNRIGIFKAAALRASQLQAAATLSLQGNSCQSCSVGFMQSTGILYARMTWHTCVTEMELRSSCQLRHYNKKEFNASMKVQGCAIVEAMMHQCRAPLQFTLTGLG
jgi:hypothetical protein